MTLPPAEWRERPGLNRLLVALDAANGSTKIVGGAVRDTLLGLPVADVDLATRLVPDEVARRIAAAGMKAVPTGIAHGTVTAVTAEGLVEVTTLRRDVATDGRHATIAYTGEWREDAARRDFTINALYADAASGAIDDYFRGLDDLAARRVRFIGDPATRIAEDHLRILRFFRFHARFGDGPPDPESLAACIERRRDLLALSRERKADELLKILALPDPAPTIALMAAHDILPGVLPAAVGEGVARLTRLVARESAHRLAGDPLLRLAALLPRDPAAVDEAAGRLRLSNKARAILRAYAAPADGRVAPRHLAQGADGRATSGRYLLADLDDAAVSAALAALDGWSPPDFPLSGGDLVRLGLVPGPAVAAMLEALRRDWIAAHFPDAATVRAAAVAAVERALRG